MNITSIRYINMDKNRRRKWLLKSLLGAVPNKILRFPGVKFDARDPAYQKYLLYGFHPSLDPVKDRSRVEGIAGCWIAHSHVLEGVSEQTGITVVLEDDFVCRSDFFENALRMVNAFNRDFDIILFDTRGDGPLEGHRVAENIYHPKNYSFPYYSGTHCMFVNNARIAKILDAKLNAQICDYDGFVLTSGKIDAYVFYTGECGTRALGSDINPGFKREYDLVDMLMCLLPYTWRERTTRFKRYFSKQEEKKYARLSEESLAAFAGDYEAQGYEFNHFRFAVLEGQLTLVAPWDGSHILLHPLSELDFFSKEFPLPMRFIKDGNGAVTQFLIYDRHVYHKRASQALASAL